MAELLFSLGANINKKNKEWCTPLHYAVQEGQTEMVVYLI
jgi:ankyrin repeat protein